MAHEIEIVKGKASAMYFGDTPWHKLGTKLDKPANSVEAIEAAGLNWTVELAPVEVEGVIVDGYHAIRRTTDKRVYTIAGDRYVPIQNSKAFEFFDAVAGDGKNKPFIYHTAGSLRNGAYIWVLAQLKGALNIKGEQIDKYICMVNSHDGSTAFKMFYTPVRVVCMNTLKMAESKATNRFYSKHTANFEQRVELAKQTLELSKKFYAEFGKTANALADKPMTVKELDAFVDSLFNIKAQTVLSQAEAIAAAADGTDQITGREKDAVLVKYLFEHGKGMDNPDTKHTRWAAFNAVTEFTDHWREPRDSKNFTKADNRLNYAWFTGGAQLKEKALGLLVAK